ncbi:MAG: hypothetical protein IJW30_06425 [Clostridia bacterium]|nr:hypothetical protein [Clostridia bacterium]MBQ9774283.1 hypothetical protein [Clostridia bacterium]
MMKRKMIVPILAVLLCVSMIGVGFAAWVIATKTTADVSGNNFEVFEVKNQTVNFTSTFTDGDVTFGAKTFDTSNGAVNNGWLTLTDGANNEDLNATLQIVINNWSSISAETITFTLSAVEIKNGSTTVTSTYANYVTMPAERTITLTNGSLDSTSVAAGITFSNGTLTVPMTMGWGSAFGNKNPIQYYNEQVPTDELTAAAESALGTVYALNSTDIKFWVTVEANVVTAPAN